MQYADRIEIRKDWVERNQSEYLIDNLHAFLRIGDSVEASNVLGEFEFNIISVSLTDEIDPLFLSTPIPNGIAVVAFYSDSFESVGFYDDVLARFEHGLPVTVQIGYLNGEFDYETWGGYFVTNATMDAAKKQITVEFEHELSKLADAPLFPLWGSIPRADPLYAPIGANTLGTLNVVRQLNDAHPELGLDDLTYESPRLNPLAKTFDTKSAYLYTHASDGVLATVTNLQNATPFSLVQNHEGQLLPYQGQHAVAQDVRIWSSETFQDSIQKENFDAGLEKQAQVRPQTLPKASTILEYDSGNTSASPSTPYDSTDTLYERLNFDPLEDTVGSSLGDAWVRMAIPRTEDGGYLWPVRHQMLQCCSDAGSRVIYTPDHSLMGSGTVEERLMTRNVQVDYRVVDTSTSTVSRSPRDIEVIDNPFGANIDACYTYPKETYKFLLRGEMRDNPSFKPNQVVYIPYGTVWAKLLLTSLTRTFTGGCRLSFEGVIIEVTDVPVRELRINSAIASLVARQDFDGDIGYMVRITIDLHSVTPPLTAPSDIIEATVNIPGHDPIELYSVGLTTFEIDAGVITYDEWINTSGTVTVSNSGLTDTAPITLSPWFAVSSQMPHANAFNVNQGIANAVLPNK